MRIISTQKYTYTGNIERNVEALKDAFKDCSFGLRYSLVASIRKVWWSFASAITHKWELSPPIVTLLSPSVSLSRTWSERRRRKGVDSTLSLPRRYASPLVCGIDVAYTRIMVDKGEQWIENCFIFRFLIRQGVSFFLGIEIVSTDNVPQLLYETSKSSLFYLRVGNVPLFPRLICNRILISNLIISQNHYHRIFQIPNRILTRHDGWYW